MQIQVTKHSHSFTFRVIVEHMVYPVTLDVIFQIFSRVGKVMKIVTFTKNNTFQVYWAQKGDNTETSIHRH